MCAVVVGEIEADIFGCARSADIGAVPRWLVDIHHSLKTFLLRMVAEACELLVVRVATDRQDWFEGALQKVSEIVRVREEKRFEAGALLGIRLLHYRTGFLNRSFDFVIHICLLAFLELLVDAALP